MHISGSGFRVLKCQILDRDLGFAMPNSGSGFRVLSHGGACEGCDWRIFVMQFDQPRLESENLEKNQKLYLALQGIALRKRCTTGQLALSWIQHQGDDVVPIPGTTKISNFDENVASLGVEFSKEDMAEIGSLFDAGSIAGDRYAVYKHLTFTYSDTPPLSSWIQPRSSLEQ
jgi:hypothetical protein